MTTEHGGGFFVGEGGTDVDGVIAAVGEVDADNVVWCGFCGGYHVQGVDVRGCKGGDGLVKAVVAVRRDKRMADFMVGCGLGFVGGLVFGVGW